MANKPLKKRPQKPKVPETQVQSKEEKSKHPGIENLKSIADRPMEEQREIQLKGGYRSGEVRREKKLMRETLRDLLAMPLKDGDIEKIKTLAEARGKNLTVQEAILLGQIKKAMAGNVQSAIFVRDTVGEKPKEELNVTQSYENPFKGLSTDELRRILFGEGGDSDETTGD